MRQSPFPCRMSSRIRCSRNLLLPRPEAPRTCIWVDRARGGRDTLVPLRVSPSTIPCGTDRSRFIENRIHYVNNIIDLTLHVVRDLLASAPFDLLYELVRMGAHFLLSEALAHLLPELLA